MSEQAIWRDIITPPLTGRNKKPRKCGLTMIIDKGMGLAETADLLDTAGEHIDLVKLAFGTSALYRPDVLCKKIGLVRSYGIDIYPGGTFLEIAVLQNKLESFLNAAKTMGFTCMEVSDGTINMPDDVRMGAIDAAAGRGFTVLSEVGKKHEDDKISVSRMAAQIKSDLGCGAGMVILEGRESGMGVGLYDRQGNFISDDLEELLLQIEDTTRIIWEAPNKNQQLELIKRFGPNVSLGNIPTGEVLSLEALRVGLRSDSLKFTL